MKNLRKLLYAAGLMIVAASMIITACTKEGPQGVAGKDGTNGKDANETCKLCHSATVVDSVAVQFELAKHSWGEAAFEEAGNAGCAPCHEHKGFLYVCKNSIPSTFSFTGGKWVNDYSSVASDAIGDITCFTCHSSLHTTYGYSDITALTTTAPVPMTMWGGTKTIDLTQDGGKSNLCVKCHQPRPLTCGNDAAGRLLNYDSVLNFPLAVMYDSTTGVKNTMLKPSYRMHVHYGAVGAVFAGKGAIEYPGTESYTNSPHSTLAACVDCHMAPMTGIAGGHAFNVRNAKESALGSGTTWNFNGCNVTGCHADNPLDATTSKWKNTRSEIKGLLDGLAAKINACGNGTDILHADATSSNLWAGISSGNYDGYLNIYDPSSNAGGAWRNPYPSGSWTASQKATNLALPKFPKLLMVQTGALINFQFCLREYSLGIHNTQYVRALLTNTVKALNDAGL